MPTCPSPRLLPPAAWSITATPQDCSERRLGFHRLYTGKTAGRNETESSMPKGEAGLWFVPKPGLFLFAKNIFLTNYSHIQPISLTVRLIKY